MDKIKSIFQFSGKHKKYMSMALFLSVLSNVFSIVPFLYVYKIIYAFMNNNSTKYVIFNYAIKAVVFSVIGIVLYFLALYLSHVVAFKTINNMKHSVIDHLMRVPMGYFEDKSTGGLRKTIDDNAGLVEDFIAHQLPDFVAVLVMPIAIIIFLFIYDWRMGLVCLIPLVLSVIFMKQMMGGESKQMIVDIMSISEDINKEAVEYVRGIPIVKVFQQSPKSMKNFYTIICKYRDVVSVYARKCQIPKTNFTVTLNSVYFFLLIAGGILFTKSANPQSTFLNLIFYFLLAPLLGGNTMRLMMLGDNLMQSVESVGRINEILQVPELMDNGKNKTPKEFNIEYKNVSFSYPNDSVKVINEVNLKIKEREMVAIVGPSGCGKTTLASLLARFYDVTDGAITIGNIDIRDITPKSLMSYVSYVFQENKMFKGSILDNLKMANPTADRNKILESLNFAQCDDIINKFPNGIDTVLGTDGIYLSGGEIQRLALARAFLKDTKILVLDEATAATDAENEKLLEKSIENISKVKTVIVIAHRLSTVVNADKIVVMNKGSILEEGSHEKLLRQNGVYSKMWSNYCAADSWKL